MPEIEGEGFAREQVNGDGVAGEGVDRHQIELLAGLRFQSQPRVAQQDFMIGLAIVKKREPGTGDGERQGIDFVEAEHVAGAAESGGYSGAQSDDGYAHRTAFLQVTHGTAHARVGAVVTGGFVATGGVQDLGSMIYGAVDQAANGGGLFILRNVANPQDAVEVAGRKTEDAIGAMLLISKMNRKTHGEGQHGDPHGANWNFAFPIAGRDPQNDGGQRAASYHREGKLQVGVKHVRRDDGYEHAA